MRTRASRREAASGHTALTIEVLIFSIMGLLSTFILLSLTAALATFQLIGPILRFAGKYVKNSTSAKREKILARLQSESNGSIDPASRRIVAGFFHPYCNAGGGGERVLWTAIRSIQSTYPNITCIIYTGDHVPKTEILQNILTRFNITLDPSRLDFIYLHKRYLVSSEQWPRFTLIGQSLGSLVLAYEAFGMLVPDMYIDTMGYAFTISMAKLLFGIPTAAYVHYPTISTDMLDNLSPENNYKRLYWQAFAWLYKCAGSGIDVVTTNSSWTAAHIASLWRGGSDPSTTVETIFPPCAVSAIHNAIPVDAPRERIILSIAQFRPEKNHELIIESFAAFLKSAPKSLQDAKLVLLGSVRHDVDEMKVYELRILVNELGITDSVEFVVNAPWGNMMDWLKKSSIGINAMWNEHFGIGVVEYQAAGLISVVHDSGGPKQDIVVNVDGGATGFHAIDIPTFSAALLEALSLSPQETLAMRKRAVQSSQRFSEEVFEKKWTGIMERLIELEKESGGGWKADLDKKQSVLRERIQREKEARKKK